VYVLDNPVWHALSGVQRDFSRIATLSARFDPEVSPFGAVADEPTDAHWEELAHIVGAGNTVVLTGATLRLSPRWNVIRRIEGVQMELAFGIKERDAAGSMGGCDGGPPRPDPSTVADVTMAPETLGMSDVPEMLRLVETAQPGPFLRRTIELGGYVGVRRDGCLVAMAGERLRPPGYAEISAVATDPAFRKGGLATRLIAHVASGIVARGETPFLHAAADNHSAIRLYEAMGFTLRRSVTFVVAEPPGSPPPKDGRPR
jgi:ribosomal protein S18 acetylase RimI-like enzyme